MQSPALPAQYSRDIRRLPILIPDPIVVKRRHRCAQASTHAAYRWGKGSVMFGQLESGHLTRMHGAPAVAPARKSFRFRSHRHASATTVHWVFASAFIALLALSYALYNASSESRAASASVRHTYEVLQVIPDIERQIARAESALRGYLVSDNA